MDIITGKTGEAHVYAGDDGIMWAEIFGDGKYVLSGGDQFTADVTSANNVRVQSGDCLINGRLGRLRYGHYEDLTIANGMAGYKRNDLIVARYTKTGGLEDMNLVVIQGSWATGTPEDPEYYSGSVIDGDTTVDLPLYRVFVDGVAIPVLTQLFNAQSGCGLDDDVWNQIESETSDDSGMNKISKVVDYFLGRLKTRTDTPTFASGWTAYQADTSQAPKIRACGNVVSLTGAVQPTAAITPGGSGVRIMSIPEWCRPGQRTLQICQGSGARKWLLDVRTNGDVLCARYGTTAVDDSLSAGTWLPFHITWILD